MDAKRITIVILAWLWQTTTTFVILLIAGLLGLGFVDGLEGDRVVSSPVAPALVALRSADAREPHPEPLVSRWPMRIPR
jgi:hypothetical protein